MSEIVVEPTINQININLFFLIKIWVMLMDALRAIVSKL